MPLSWLLGVIRTRLDSSVASTDLQRDPAAQVLVPPLRELEAFLFDTMARVGWRELLDTLREGADPAAAAPPAAAAFGQVIPLAGGL